MVWWCSGETGAQTTGATVVWVPSFENLLKLVFSMAKQRIVIKKNSPRAQTMRYASFGPDIDVEAFKDGGSSCYPVVLAVKKKIYK